MSLQINDKTNFVFSVVFTIFGIGMILVGIGVWLFWDNAIYSIGVIAGGAIMTGRSIVSMLQELDVLL